MPEWMVGDWAWFVPSEDEGPEFEMPVRGRITAIYRDTMDATCRARHGRGTTTTRSFRTRNARASKAEALQQQLAGYRALQRRVNQFVANMQTALDKEQKREHERDMQDLAQYERTAKFEDCNL